MARTALQITRAVVRLLGDGWTGVATGSAARAGLEGPDGLCLDGEIRSSASSRGSIRFEARSSFEQATSPYIGTTRAVDDVEGIAEWIRSRALPDWQERTARTGRAVGALAFVTAEVTRLFPDATVSSGARPGIASIRWSGGAAHLRGRGDGTVDFAKIVLDEVDGWAGLRVLAALGSGQTPSTDS
ncbi:hypothetical protein, partial [Kitasatospora sp. NPDC094016]|uniref:hypothetical protein n=1 Tax=Kitasatospora sp. NPDC094016 TaxID=3154986 RepID=UPI0033340CAA